MAQLRPQDERALIDGVPARLDQARVTLAEGGLLRGDGGFETVGVWDGHPFRLEDHLDRLDRTMDALALPRPDRRRLREDAVVLTDGLHEDAALRLYVLSGGTRIAMLAQQPRRAPIRSLLPVPAPWIVPARPGEPSGAKTMSYANNMTATRRAQAAGADDALLHSVPARHILEGPTFAVMFVARGVLHAPDVSLGIVDSISRRTLLDIARAHGLDILEGIWSLEALADADEVVVSSSLRPVLAVTRVGGWRYSRPSPVADLLAAELERHRRRG